MELGAVRQRPLASMCPAPSSSRHFPRRRNFRARTRSDPSARGTTRTPVRAMLPPSAPAATAPCPSCSPRAPARRRRRRRRCAQQVLEHPLAAQHDRGAVGIRRHGQDAALPEQAAAVRIGQRHAAELRAVDARDTVVLRQALVDERIVGVSRSSKLRSSRTMLPTKSSVSLVKAARSAFVEREDLGSGRTFRRCADAATARQSSR